MQPTHASAPEWYRNPKVLSYGEMLAARRVINDRGFSLGLPSL